MVTLIAVYNQNGCLGRCTEYCYDDVDAACDCVCHGMNHGVGFAVAVKNTARHCAHWVHRNNFPPGTPLPTAVRLHPAVHDTQVVLDLPAGNLYLMKRKPE